MSSTISEERFENQGAKGIVYKELVISGFPAKYVYMKSETSEIINVLYFGDSTFSTSIIAVSPAMDNDVAKQIKDALFSIVYDKEFKIDPLANAIFELDESVSKFKFFKSLSNSYLYTIEGAEIKTNKDAPIITVIPFPIDDTMTPEMLLEILFSSQLKEELNENDIRNKSLDKINGYSAVEAEIFANLDGQRNLLYFMIIVSGDKGLAILGISKTDFEKNIIEFKQFAHTAKFK
jgi:hypothetical protein